MDELCTCGHLKSVHAPSEAGLAHGVIVAGHGSCRDPTCGCNQFTFKDWA